MGYYFTKHHQFYHHREIRATYLYIKNALLKVNHEIVHKWSNAVFTPIYMVAINPIHTITITTNHTILQECANVVHAHGHTNTTSVA